MRSDTRIFIFRLRQLIFVLFLLAVLCVVVVCLIRSNDSAAESEPDTAASAYIPGVYTSSITLNNQAVDIQVVVDQDRIKSASIVHLEESVATMYPLLTTCMADISAQLTAGVSPEDVTYADSSRYTASVLLGAISKALENACE